MPPADVVAAVVAFLNADAAVAARTQGRVYGGELPRDQNVSMPQPAVVLRPAGGGALGRAYQQFGDQRIDAYSYGATVRDAWLLHLDVRAALKQMRRQTLAGTVLHWARISSDGTTAIDPVTQWPCATASYQVLAGDLAVA